MALVAALVSEVAAAVAELAAAVAYCETPVALLAALVADVLAAAALVVAVVAESLALTALAAASLAFVVAMTACCVTASNVASLLLSPAPPSPLNIAIVAPTKTRERGVKRKGTPRRIPQFSLKYS